MVQCISEMGRGGEGCHYQSQHLISVTGVQRLFDPVRGSKSWISPLSFGNMGNAAIPNEIFLYMYDTILAQEDEIFTTWSGCNKKLCSRCNYQGSASRYTLYWRSEYTKHKGETLMYLLA